MAEQLGFTIRLRNINPLDFILSLIAALGGDGNSTTQADLYPFPLEMWVGGKRTKPHEPTSSR